MFIFKYNYIEIGNRIRKEREKLGLSQDELLNSIRDKGKPCFGRNTLSKLENGDQAAFNAISIAKLSALCDEFECSISYLMGEYNFRNYDQKFICESTGLLESNLEKIMGEKNDFLNTLIGSRLFFETDYSFHQMLQSISDLDRCIHALKKIEDTANLLPKDSTEYQEKKKLYFNTLSASERFECQLNYSIYKIGLNFGNILEEFRDSKIHDIKRAPDT